MALYKVVEMRETAIRGRINGAKLEKLLNEYGSQGWTLKAITPVDVKGLGGSGVEGIVIVFEKL